MMHARFKSFAHKHLIPLIMIVGVVVMSVGLLSACAPKDVHEKPVAQSAVGSDELPTGEYVSDEECMRCHGGSYEAVAELTADMGEWNPHNPIHGGYNSCDNCHAGDMSVKDNYCTHCHNFDYAAEKAALAG